MRWQKKAGQFQYIETGSIKRNNLNKSKAKMLANSHDVKTTNSAYLRGLLAEELLGSMLTYQKTQHHYINKNQI